MLIGARALQGLGAAFISPAALAIITTTFQEGAERAKALGVWAAIAIGGSAVGLIVGGALTQLLSWPWIFFINVPVGIVVFVALGADVPESRDEAAERNFDVAGAVTVTGGLMTLVYAIVEAQRARLDVRPRRSARSPSRPCCSSPSSRSSCVRRRRSSGSRSSAPAR